MAFITSPASAVISRHSNPLRTTSRPSAPVRAPSARRSTLMTAAPRPSKRQGNEIRGKVFVVLDNIDTDQIIPAEYLTLVPSNPSEYRELGSYALIGLPAEQYTTRYVKDGQFETDYPIVIAGDNFGCGSSREHAPVSMGAAGGCAVVAQSYARIFFRNCTATGELYPWESIQRLVDHFQTGDEAVIDFEKKTVTNEATGQSFGLHDLGDVQPVIDAGGIFEFARQSGMIEKKE